MGLGLHIARKLSLGKNNGRGTSTSVRISIAGVALSIAIMLLTIAITAGFKKEITERLLGFNSQITLTSYAFADLEAEPIDLTSNIVDIVKIVCPEAVIDEAMQQPAMLKTTEDFAAVIFRAYNGTSHTSFISDNIIAGELPDFSTAEDQIIISSHTASTLNLNPGDKISTCFFVNGKMRLRNFTVAAIFSSGFSDYDTTVAYAPLSVIKKITGLEANQASTLEISGLDMSTLQQTAATLQQELNNAYYSCDINTPVRVTTVLQTGAQYFNWLSLLDTNVVVILIIMIAISAFTLIASLFILILERVNTIGVLKTLGAGNRLIQRTFILLDCRILLRGLLWGNVAGLLIIFIQHTWHILPLDPESYFISFVPVDLSLISIVLLNVGAIVASIFAMILPSTIITRMAPARTLRYE